MTHPQLRRLQIHAGPLAVPSFTFRPDVNERRHAHDTPPLFALIAAVLDFDFTPLLPLDYDLEFDLTYPAWHSDDLVAAHGRVRNAGSFHVDLELSTGDQHLELVGDSMHFAGATTRVTPAAPPGHVIPWDHLRRVRDHRMVGLWPAFTTFTARAGDRDLAALCTDLAFQLRTEPRPWRPTLTDAAGLPRILVDTLTHALAFAGDADAMCAGLRYTADDALPTYFDREPPAPFRPLLAALDADALLIRPNVRHTAADALDCRGLDLQLIRGSDHIPAADLPDSERRLLGLGLLLLIRPHHPVVLAAVDRGLDGRHGAAVRRMLHGRQAFVSHDHD